MTGFRTLVFDCDGVILDSNRIKTDAFRIAAEPYGPEAAAALVALHTGSGGVSRYRKFAHFLAHIVPAAAAGATAPEAVLAGAPEIGGEGGAPVDPAELEALLARYAAAVVSALHSCPVAAGLADFRAATSGARWLVVSGGDQAELRETFARRGLAPMFDGGIFGSPDTKDEILAREIAAGNIALPALFLGDSRYDHEAADRAGLDFVFLDGWSEYGGLHAHARAHGLPVRRDIAALLADLPAPRAPA